MGRRERDRCGRCGSWAQFGTRDGYLVEWCGQCQRERVYDRSQRVEEEFSHQLEHGEAGGWARGRKSVMQRRAVDRAFVKLLELLREEPDGDGKS